MKPRIYFALMIILAASALFGCGGGGDDGPGVDGNVNPPAQFTRADVSIAFDQPVANLAGLMFKVTNTAGATIDNNDASKITAINAALGSVVAGNFDVAANSTTIGLANATGFSTGTSPIIRITYTLAAGYSTPVFSIDTAPENFEVYDSDSALVTAITATNMVVTVTYTAE